MKKFAALLAIPILAAPALMQSGVAVSQPDSVSAANACAHVEDSKSRLNCYDLFFQSLPAPQKSGSLGLWKVNARRATSDKSARVVIRVPAETLLSDYKGDERKAYVYAACRSEKVTLWVNFDQPLEVHPQEMPITVRFDKADEETVMMQNSYNWLSLGIWDDLRSKELLNRLETTERFMVKATPKEGDEISASFNVSKLSNALKPLQKACDWNS